MRVLARAAALLKKSLRRTLMRKCEDPMSASPSSRERLPLLVERRLMAPVLHSIAVEVARTFLTNCQNFRKSEASLDVSTYCWSEYMLLALRMSLSRLLSCRAGANLPSCWF